MIRAIFISILLLGAFRSEAQTLNVTFDFGACSGVAKSVNGLTVLCWTNRIAPRSSPSEDPNTLVEIGLYRRSAVGWEHVKQDTLDLRTVDTSECRLNEFSEAKISNDGKRILVLSEDESYDSVCMIDGPAFSKAKRMPDKFVKYLMTSKGSVNSSRFSDLELSGDLTHVLYRADANDYFLSLDTGDNLFNPQQPFVSFIAPSSEFAVADGAGKLSFIHLKTGATVYEYSGGIYSMSSNIVIKDGKIQFFGDDYYLNEIDITSGKITRKLLSSYSSSYYYIWMNDLGCSIAEARVSGRSKYVRLDIVNDVNLGAVSGRLFSYEISADCRFAVHSTASLHNGTLSKEIIDLSTGRSVGKHFLTKLSASQEFKFINQYGDLFYRYESRAGILSYK